MSLNLQPDVQYIVSFWTNRGINTVDMLRMAVKFPTECTSTNMPGEYLHLGIEDWPLSLLGTGQTARWYSREDNIHRV